MISPASFFLLTVLFMLSTFFSIAETAFFSLNKLDRDFIQRNHPYFGKWVLQHLEKPRKTLSTILIGNLVSNIWATALVASESYAAGGAQAAVVATAVFGILLTLFGEMTAKVIALQFKIPAALLSAPPMLAFGFLFTPVQVCMKYFTDMIFKLFSRDKSDSEDALTEDELKVLVSIGEEEGMLDADERKRLHELFELGSRPVKEIMTPRTDLAGLDADQPAEKHFEMIRKNHYSLMPVFQNSMDQIIGVVDTQTYLLVEDARLRQIMKKPVFIPETKKISDLLAEFRASGEDFAVCVDEHGGTAGIVTLEDILEEIFGEFDDEYSKPKEPIRELDDHSFLVEAKISLDDFNEYFKCQLHSESETTLGGYLMEQLGEIPAKGMRFENEHFDFQIQDMQRQRIRTVVVRRKV